MLRRKRAAGAPHQFGSDERGAIMLESALSFILYGFIVAFIFDAGSVLFHYSTLITTNEALTRYLSVRLGHGMSTGTAGSCTNFLATEGSSFLSRELDPSSYSMTGGPALYSFDASVVSDPTSPYAIVRIVATMQPMCLSCGFFKHVSISTESSMVVEYDVKTCS